MDFFTYIWYYGNVKNNRKRSQRMKIFTSVPSENIYFEESTVEAGNAPERTEMAVINVFDEFEYQSMIGFGGAFTESAAYNYAQLTDEQKKNVLAITDRKEAIRTACALAAKGDVIVVAGKGHENYQDIQGVKHHFDDKEVLREIFNI